jgi:hypothetical protein
MSNIQQEGKSDYDIEWELQTDDPEQSSVDNKSDRQTPEGDTVSPEGASEANSEETSQEANPNSAESKEADLWANATPEQMDAYRRAENERTSANNRAKLNADKLAERGRELKALRDKTLELEEAARKPTEFEAEHEVYGKNIQEMIQRELDGRLPPVEEAPAITEQEVEQQTFDAITTAHPDAGDLYRSEALQALLLEDPVFKHGGRAALFSEFLHSNEPSDVVAALDYYKQSHTPQATSDGSGLEGMQAAPSRGGKPDMRSSNQLTQSEQYSREWDVDD